MVQNAFSDSTLQRIPPLNHWQRPVLYLRCSRTGTDGSRTIIKQPGDLNPDFPSRPLKGVNSTDSETDYSERRKPAYGTRDHHHSTFQV